MAVLVLNIGSSTVKYRLGAEGGTIDGHDGLDDLLRGIRPAPEAIGHRVVHGGDRFHEPVLVDDDVIAAIADLEPLAPLHNPANLRGVLRCRELFPGVPQVAVFDTAFHATLPPEARTYAVPREWGVRRYGFHGISCASVTRRLPGVANLIVLHLGNGASATAISHGRSVDTSMGLTPLEGLVMGSRSGDVDPGLAGYLARVKGMDVATFTDALTHESGLRALAGTGDLREVRQSLALEVYCRAVRKYVGAYYAVLGTVDAIVFTGGVGEHDARVRAMALSGLERLGIAIDAGLNERDAPEISPPGSQVRVLVMPADEEEEITRQTRQVLTRV
ncbi:acetate/propionate family kinase [Nonomuraea soli]|uniref:Acetate kinase n=1 Tax=Nonomuraea soli TaxID=1032476 RepID=A0A7W0CFN4_9ACTN|nr:acetate/propionate family kinase [Nonomuraea soli]MBA2890299.1 acetate kinase [Nonomuraea soli]